MFIDKIVCVGKNYLEHALETGDQVPKTPVLFLKPPSVLKQAPEWDDELTLHFPNNETKVQPECEIALRVAYDGFKMSKEEARHAIDAVTLGLDMTLRTQQTALKKQGHPWTTAKVFLDAAAIGPWIPYDAFPEYLTETFQLTIDGQLCQRAKGLDMMMLPEELLVYISHYFPLKKGDIIFTGTPAGVSSISNGSIAQVSWGQKQYQVRWKTEQL